MPQSVRRLGLHHRSKLRSGQQCCGNDECTEQTDRSYSLHRFTGRVGWGGWMDRDCTSTHKNSVFGQKLKRFLLESYDDQLKCCYRLRVARSKCALLSMALVNRVSCPNSTCNKIGAVLTSNGCASSSSSFISSIFFHFCSLHPHTWVKNNFFFWRWPSCFDELDREEDWKQQVSNVLTIGRSSGNVPSTTLTIFYINLNDQESFAIV